MARDAPGHPLRPLPNGRHPFTWQSSAHSLMIRGAEGWSLRVSLRTARSCPIAHCIAAADVSVPAMKTSYETYQQENQFEIWILIVGQRKHTNRKDFMSFLVSFISAVGSLRSYFSMTATNFFPFPEKSNIFKGPNTSPTLTFPASSKHVLTSFLISSASLSVPEHLVLIAILQITLLV